jgi:hypothetical protein
VLPTEVAEPLTSSAVISPPKSESLVTSLTASAVPSRSLAAAVAEAASAVTTEPSSG